MSSMDFLKVFTTNVYPLAIVLGVLAGLVVLLTIPPLIWHSRHRNFAPSFLIACILVNNVFNLVNAAIWHNDKFNTWFSGVGWCDLHTKIIIANSTALPAATLCILKKLADVMNTKKINLAPSEAQQRRRAIFEGAMCGGIPALTMFLHFIVQSTRYSIVGISGCTPSIANTWISVFFIILPPAILALVNVYFAVMIMVRLRLYRTRFDSLLQASSTTKSRFLRLYLLSLTFVLAIFPIQIYLLFVNWPKHPNPFNWRRIHNYEEWKHIAYIPSLGVVLVDRWVQVACGFLVFIFFGLGKEAKDMYKSWALALGLERLSRFMPTKKSETALFTTGRFSVFGKARGLLLSSFSTKDHEKTTATKSTASDSTTDVEMQTVTHTTTITSEHTDRSLLNDKSDNAVVSVVSVSRDSRKGEGGRT
ncbi:pheromone A receptor-like protein [Elsinoe australis]|uniref:Pheromone A receptor-like protein n=1 Tax=Elsinoe australis TaxID=40998 RepID=A0A4U7ASP9_9PEZI|nr:pheromone A receptor-like protein [Elsinoe australis]